MIIWCFLWTMRQNSQFSMCTMSLSELNICLLSVLYENFSDVQGRNESFILTMSSTLINIEERFPLNNGYYE